MRHMSLRVALSVLMAFTLFVAPIATVFAVPHAPSHAHASMAMEGTPAHDSGCCDENKAATDCSAHCASCAVVAADAPRALSEKPSERVFLPPVALAGSQARAPDTAPPKAS
jgi:hypothetical protein